MTGLRIVEPRSDAEMGAFFALNRDYRDLLLALPEPEARFVRLAYPDGKYDAVLAASDTANRAPNGMMRLVLLDGRPVGCGSVQTAAPGDAEIKRVYIAPQAQGRGAGRALMEQLIADCRTLGFRRILMDTGKALTGAARLYDAMGFQRRGPYRDMPPEADGLMIFFEMRLD